MTARYQYPGVYITEVAVNPRPIESVSTSVAGFIGTDVIAKIQRLVDQVPQDPTTGTALLELMAWLTDNLIRRMDKVPDRANLAAARLAVIALALVRDGAQPDGSVLKHVRYFEGQLIEDDELSSGIGDKLRICIKKKTG
jgi:phage tail sheath protein FI